MFVNPYMTLVAAYERLIGARGTEIKDGDPVPPSAVVAPVIEHPRRVPAIAEAPPPDGSRDRRQRCSKKPPRCARPSMEPRKRRHRKNAGTARLSTPPQGTQCACGRKPQGAFAVSQISETLNFQSERLFARARRLECRMPRIPTANSPCPPRLEPPRFAVGRARRRDQRRFRRTCVGGAVAGLRPLGRGVSRARAIKRGISEQTYNRVMSAVTPDTSVFAVQRAQPEFTEQMWQYINRRCSEWRVNTGKERAREYAGLLARLEKDYGVDRYTLLGLWGMESSFGDVVVNTKYMRPVIPALAALAYGEPRRRAYWEAELLNALTIIDRGWAQPAEMIGSWAGAMGHTQWMPEVWLHMGVDYDSDGRVSPFGKPDDSLAGTARYLVERGKYRRGEAWGCEVKLPAGPRRGSPTTAPCAATPNGRSSACGAPTARPLRGRTTR